MTQVQRRNDLLSFLLECRVLYLEKNTLIVLTRLMLTAINSFTLLGLVRKLRLEKELICRDYQKRISYNVVTFSFQNVILWNWIDILFYCMTRLYHWPNFHTFYWLSLIPISNIERCFYLKKKSKWLIEMNSIQNFLTSSNLFYSK